MTRPRARASTRPSTVGPTAAASWLALALIAATFIAYAPALGGDFLWDDDRYVSQNSTLRSLDGLTQIWLTPSASPQYYPLVFTAFWVEYRLWGLAPTGYHVVNLLLHVANALLLWLVLHRLRVTAAYAAALLFALHPVHVESVAWITERKDVLATLFSLLTLIAWLRWESAPRVSRYGAVIALFTAAMLSKTVACTLPVVLLLLTWWRTPAAWRRALAGALPLLAIGAVLARVTMWREALGDPLELPARHLNDVERVLIAGRALWFYVAKLVWPTDLVTTYPLWPVDSHSPAQWIFPAAVLIVIAALWRARERVGRGPLVAVLAFIAALAPTLGFTDFEFMRLSYVADHFQYFASAALMALGVAVIAHALARAGAPRWSGPALALSIAVVLATLTYAQAGIYRDAESLWRHTLAIHPDGATAHYNLGTIAMNRGHLDTAVEHFTAALRARPDYANAHNNLASVLLAKGQLDAAADHYRTAISLNPAKANSHYNLAVILRAQGHSEAAREQFAEALRLRPDFAEAAAALRELNH